MSKVKRCRCGRRSDHKSFCPWRGPAVARPPFKLIRKGLNIFGPEDRRGQ